VTHNVAMTTLITSPSAQAAHEHSNWRSLPLLNRWMHLAGLFHSVKTVTYTAKLQCLHLSSRCLFIPLWCGQSLHDEYRRPTPMKANSATAAQRTLFTVMSRPSRIIPDRVIFCSRFIPTATDLFESGTTSSIHAAETTGIPLVIVLFPSIRSGTSSLWPYDDHLQGGYGDLDSESGTRGDEPRPHTRPLALARVVIGAYPDPHCSTTDRPTDAVTVDVTVTLTAAVVVPA